MNRAIQTAELQDFVSALPQGLDTVVSERGTNLSGGQKQRIMLARALAIRPEVILLDEPFTGVDVKTEKQIIDLLLQLREEGHTILISTHDLASISTFCDRTILINRTILAEGKTAMVLTEENLALTFGGLPLTHTPIVHSSLNPGSFLTSERSEQDFPLFCNL